MGLAGLGGGGGAALVSLSRPNPLIYNKKLILMSAVYNFLGRATLIFGIL
jgi:hypothetical protein